ncbi:MAG: lysophospholipid acyltransferase family protein [Chitinophagales bacterium]
MKGLLLIFYNLWAYISFFLFAALGVPWYAFVLIFKLPEKYFYLYSRIWAKIWTRLVFIRCKIYGKENIEKGQPYIIVCNHQSVADIFIVPYALEMDYRPLGKVELKKIPILGWLFARALIFVDRSDERSRRKSNGLLKAVLKQGISVLIFPEGTRNRTGRPLKDFYSGAFRIAAETGVPILPMVITGILKLTPQHTLLGQPGSIDCRFFPPISTKDKNFQELQDEVYKLMWECVAENDPVLGKSSD